MRKILSVTGVMRIMLTLWFPAFASEIAETPAMETVAVELTPEQTPTTPWMWAYPATIAGATAATCLIVEFFQVPLDHVWKIPTRVFVYIIAFVILTVATGLDANTFLLYILDSFIVAFAAYGAYEVTFARLDR